MGHQFSKIDNSENESFEIVLHQEIGTAQLALCANNDSATVAHHEIELVMKVNEFVSDPNVV